VSVERLSDTQCLCVQESGKSLVQRTKSDTPLARYFISSLSSWTAYVCCTSPTRKEFPSSDGVLYLFYDVRTTQNSTYSDKLHVPNLYCIQQLFWKYEKEEGIERDCAECGKRKRTFWDDPVGEMLSYL
jgi:hypothetical protein